MNMEAGGLEVSLYSTRWAVMGLPPSLAMAVHLRAITSEEVAVAERRMGAEGGTEGREETEQKQCKDCFRPKLATIYTDFY